MRLRRAIAPPVLLAALWFAAVAHASPYLPPAGRVFAGVTGGSDTSAYERQVGSHPAVFQFFTSWNQPAEWMFAAAAKARSRLMMHVGTGPGGGREDISPGQIARGAGDGYLLRLGQLIAGPGAPVYIRLMAEMDGHWNAYSAFDANGRSRGADHSTSAFRRAWRRSVLVVRGGEVAGIDARLRALGMPGVRTRAAVLPRPKVAFMWVPQVAGSPDTGANSPRAYWPGAGYVDWVGTDFYSKFPNFSGLERFYSEFRGKPFAFGEWALWGRDDPAFVDRLFGWAASHSRTRMLMYNQGVRNDGPFRLSRYPRARHAIARWLGGGGFAPFAPELSAGR
jgi:hypothetical protein